MKTIIANFLVTVFIAILLPEIVLSQKINTKNESAPVILEKRIDNSFKTRSGHFSEKDIEITKEMSRLKENYSKENIHRIEELQNNLSGKNIEKNNRQEINLISPDAKHFTSLPDQSDQLTLNEIYSSNSAYIKAIATQTEQRNPGAGTIWVVIAVGAGDVGVGASPDTLLYYNSTNNGNSYSLAIRAPLNVGIKVNYDEMDLEIIEPFTYEKYLHVVVAVITDGFTGSNLVGLISLRKSDLLLGGGPSLSFPGFNYSLNKYSKPRITSDNAKYPAEAYLTISVIQDSTDGINNFIMTKVCKVFNPYALISGGSQITYLSQSIHAPVSGYSYTAQTDVAYYNSNGNVQGDSIIFVQSGFPGTEKFVNIYRNYGNTLVYPSYSGSLSGPNYRKEYARIATNGGSNQKSIYIVWVEKDTSMGYSFSSINSFRTTNGINWVYSQLAGGGDNNSEVKNPDIIGKRETEGKFYITNKWVLPGKDEISSFVIQNSILKSFTAEHNNQFNASCASPKPGLRFINNDSCLTIWPVYTGVYSSCGCKALNLSLGFIIEGLYNPANDSAGIDKVDIHLRNILPPYNILKTVTGYNLFFATFPDAAPGNYYISVNHRNSIETWYYQPVNLNDSVLKYIDFYSSQSNAFGNNLKLVDSYPYNIFAVYSGDVNQDGTIDASDVSQTDNDSYNSLSGYVNTDVTGDNFVDAADVSIVDNNAFNAVSIVRP